MGGKKRPRIAADIDWALKGRGDSIGGDVIMRRANPAACNDRIMGL